MFATLSKIFGSRFAAKAAKQVVRARLGVEQLDERLMPSSVPALTGVTLNLDWSPVASTTRSLTILSEHDNGNGTGSFTALFIDRSVGTFAPVAGTLALKHVASGVGDRYDYGLNYVGITGFGSGLMEVGGSGDFTTTSVNTPASSYTQYTWGNPYWGYSGSDVEVVVSGPLAGWGWSHADSDLQAVWLH
jgi:hypothetical protein